MNALGSLFCALGLSLVALGDARAAGAAKPAPAPAHPVAAKQRSPGNECRYKCRKARQACVRSGKAGYSCFKERQQCYRPCGKLGGGGR